MSIRQGKKQKRNDRQRRAGENGEIEKRRGDRFGGGTRKHIRNQRQEKQRERDRFAKEKAREFTLTP